MPWSENLEGLSTSDTTSITAIQNYFESAWHLDISDPKVINRLNIGDRPNLILATVAQSPESDAPLNPDTIFYRTDFDDDNNPIAQAVEGVVARHSSGRFYQLLPMDVEQPLKLPDPSAGISPRGSL